MAQEGLVSVASRHSAPETMARLLAALEKRDLAVFARIDHAANAAAVGMPLRPTEVVLFGNPKGGTVLMLDQQRAGLGPASAAAVCAMAKALAAIAEEATNKFKPPPPIVSFVTAGHGRSKKGVASLAYAPRGACWRAGCMDCRIQSGNNVRY